MSKRTRARLLSLVLLLGVLVGVLATPAGQSAEAVMCCDSCWDVYQSCIDRWGPYFPPCESQLEQCLGTCSAC